MLDLGYVAFFAIGAYTMAILGTKTSLNFWEIMPIGVGLAMLSGVLLGKELHLKLACKRQ